MKIKILNGFYALIFFSIPFFTLLATNQFLRDYSYILYITQQILFIRIVGRDKYVYLFMTPIMLIISYINISFSIASFAYANNLVYEAGDLYGFNHWNYLNITTFYVLMANNILFTVNNRFKKNYLNIVNLSTIQIQNGVLNNYSIIALIFLVAFTFLPLDISLLGGSGDVSMIPKTVSALLFVYILVYKNITNRYLIYIVILLYFSSFSFTSKREAIFLIFSIFLIESLVNNIVVKFRLVLFGVFTIFFILILILVMSIMRGYGGYMTSENASMSLAISYIGDYISSEFFLLYFLNNLEVNATYFHSINAMEYVITNPSLLQFGSTIIKVFFIILPSSVVDFKPDSMLNLYTLTKDASYRAVGGSWPVNIYAEYFWNFHIFGLFFLPFFFYFINYVFLQVFSYIKTGKIIYHSWMLYAYMELITFARGSGLDMYIIYIIFAIFFSTTYVLIQKILANNKLIIKI